MFNYVCLILQGFDVVYFVIILCFTNFSGFMFCPDLNYSQGLWFNDECYILSKCFHQDVSNLGKELKIISFDKRSSTPRFSTTSLT